MTGTGFLRIAAIAALGFGLTACQSAEERAAEHYEAALTLISEGDPDRAVVELRNVFQLDGSHQEARRLLAQLMVERGNRQEAYSQYLRLAEQYPDDLEARLELSRMAFEGRNWDEVDRHGLVAQELAPDDPRVRVIETARAYRDAAQGDDASARREIAAEAEAQLAEQPDDTILQNVLIDNHLRDSEFSEALVLIRALLEDDPENPAYNEQLTGVLAQIGDTDALEAQLRRMVKLQPEETGPKTRLIRFFMSNDEPDKAEAFLRELAEAAPEGDTAPRVDVIQFLIRTKGEEAARAEIEEAIATAADPVPFRMIRAGMDFTGGARDAAVAEVEDVLAGAEPSDQIDEIKVTLARMLLAMGNEVGARTQVEEVLARSATQPEALKMQARWNIEEDDTDAAIAALRTALDQEAEDAEAMTLMADAYIRAGSPQLARDFLALAVETSGNAPAESIRYARLLVEEERYLPAEDILLPALRLSPNNLELLLTLGQLYMAMEDYARTGQVVDTLRRIDSPEARQAADGLEAARIEAQSGTEEAMDYLETLAGSADADASSQLTLLRARLGTGDVEGALAMATQMQEENPEDPQLKYALAVTRAASGDVAGAETLYREMIEADPNRPALWIDLSRLKLRAGDRAASQAVLEEGLTHLPDDPQLLWGKASFLEQDNQIDAAIEVYETLYERDSSSVVVVNNLASLLATYRDDPESLDRAWTIARRMRDTELPPMQDTYGWIAHKRGDSEDALPYLESAASGLPNDPLVQYHLGEVYRALDRPADALAQMERAVNLAGATDQRPQIETARALVLSLPDEIAAAADADADAAPAETESGN
ncbi:tetratricopeptide repeat protein [uncultured Jannaschia sp.]|uniref:tetratricopeptide repeat protein n=1 Tax=uncultured Jannaschia sp. TaxID=293347 RepID=UPI002623AE52|nr:tetratricopeptide repeat protein [uncultured Jannaschia sp.]